MINGNEQSVRKPIKERRTGTVKELRDTSNQLLQKICGHTVRIKKQLSSLKHLIEEAGEDTAIVIVDVSENDNAKYACETQGTHFGASQVQVTMHTGVAYICNKPVSFATISPSYAHGPHGIWAFMQPVFQYRKVKVKYLHLWSRGPTTQYRNKHNFWLMAKIAPTIFDGAT